MATSINARAGTDRPYHKCTGDPACARGNAGPCVPARFFTLMFYSALRVLAIPAA